MAKRKVNKSFEIRQELAKSNWTAKPAEVVAVLAERGISVTPGQVANVKSKEKNSGGASAQSNSARKPGRKPAAASGTISSKDVQALLTIQKLVEEYGASGTKQLVDQVATVRVNF